MKFNLHLMIFLGCFFPLWGWSQIRAVDAQQQPIAQVQLQFLTSGAIYTSDSDGAFHLPDREPGTYLIMLSAMGWRNLKTVLTYPLPQTMSWTLTPQVTELKEVVITSVGKTTLQREIPVTIQAISAAEWQQQAVSNAVAALQKVPGVQALTTGTAIAKPMIRGLGYNRVLSLWNGIRMEGQQWGDEHGLELDVHAVDRVEIIKGPGSLWYGSDAMAGVIHFMAPTFSTQKGWQFQALQAYHSNANLWDQSGSVRFQNDHHLFWGQSSLKSARNFQTPTDGRVLNSGFREWDAMFQWGVRGQWGKSILRWSRYSIQLGMPEGERNDLGQFTFVDAQGSTQTATDADLSSCGIGYPQQRIEQLTFNGQHELKFNRHEWQTDWAYQSNRRREFGQADFPDRPNIDMQLRSLAWNSRFHGVMSIPHQITLGTSGMWQQHANQAFERIIPNYSLMDLGVYFTYNHRFNARWNHMMGLRYDNRWYSQSDTWTNDEGVEVPPNAATLHPFEALSKRFDGFSASVGTAYNPNGAHTLKCNFSLGYRAPNAAELSSNGRHEGTFRYELGNAQLQSEHQWQWDVSYQYRNEHVDLACSPFVSIIQGYMHPQRLRDAQGHDVVMDPNDPVPTYVFQQGRALLFGGEFQMDWHPHPWDWLHIEPSLAWVRGTITDGATDYLPMMPPPQANLRCKGQWKKLHSHWVDPYISLHAQYTAAQGQIAYTGNTETPTSSYQLWNVSAGITWSSSQLGQWICQFGIDNLWNTTYQSHLNRLKYAPMNPQNGQMGIMNPGRNMWLQLRWNLGD